MTWQPIETAPKDGTHVDLWVKWWRPDTDTFTGARCPDCMWFVTSKQWSSEHSMRVGKFTHWMPIPDPPK